MAGTISPQTNKASSGAANGANGYHNDPLPVVNSNGDVPPNWEASGHNISYAEFLDWADEDTLAEWVNGDIVMTSPANFRHQYIGRFLIKVMDTFVEVNDLGVIIQPPFQMHLAGISGREPDLMFVRKARMDIMRNSSTNGPADLAIEIVSPESVDRDYDDKFTEYAAGGVPEYWLLDAINDTATFYQLDTDGHYQAMPLDEQGRYYSSSVTGFWLKPEWLWQQPLPNAVRVLRRVGGQAVVDYYNTQLQALDDEI